MIALWAYVHLLAARRPCVCVHVWAVACTCLSACVCAVACVCVWVQPTAAKQHSTPQLLLASPSAAGRAWRHGVRLRFRVCWGGSRHLWFHQEGGEGRTVWMRPVDKARNSKGRQGTHKDGNAAVMRAIQYSSTLTRRCPSGITAGCVSYTGQRCGSFSTFL